MSYKLKISETAVKSLKRISKSDRSKIVEKIEALKEEPRPEGCKKLKGMRKGTFYRMRAGNYRIIYSICDDVLVVFVVDVGHRKEIYR